MTETLHFAPDLKVVGRFPATANIADLAEEVGVYSASPDFVRAHCGPVATSILQSVPESFYAEAEALGLLVNIDVRIHRLYPGDFPGYPGWHCDGEYRVDYHAQPDMRKVGEHHHLVGTVSTAAEGVCLTEFLTEAVDIPLLVAPSTERTLWGQVHEELSQRSVSTTRAQDGELYQFGSWTLHRATPAVVRGWRLFFRASMWHKEYLGEEGRISRQEQVYKVLEGSGW